MALTAKQRQALRSIFGGRCAYCGCELPEKGWHADHVEPVGRITDYTTVEGKFKLIRTGEVSCPENERTDNYYPACAPCNLFKASYSVEGFRRTIANQVTRARETSVNFRTAERFGLIQSTEQPVVFWFERYSQEPSTRSASHE